MNYEQFKSILERPTRRTLGLMSGTSADGVDIAYCEIDARSRQFQNWYSATFPYPAALREAILEIAKSDTVRPTELIILSTTIGHFFADSIGQFQKQFQISADDIDLIGSHGQTVAHLSRPVYTDFRKLTGTLQIGDGDIVAKRTAIVTVSDFRSGDTAVGGSGAPLAPIYHQFRFASEQEDRVIVNIGGISNITVLTKSGECIASDAGPGNCLTDSLVMQLTGRQFDTGGMLASAGLINEPLLKAFLDNEIMHRALPTSYDRGEFVRLLYRPEIQSQILTVGVETALATLNELTAVGIRNAVERLTPGLSPQLVLVCGGGLHNDLMINRLRHHFAKAKVDSTTQFGSDADYVEAEAFAYLANLTLNLEPGNLPHATGAARAAVLGKISLP